MTFDRQTDRETIIYSFAIGWVASFTWEYNLIYWQELN